MHVVEARLIGKSVTLKLLDDVYEYISRTFLQCLSNVSLESLPDHNDSTKLGCHGSRGSLSSWQAQVLTLSAVI